MNRLVQLFGRLRGHQDGASAIEFALAAPLVFLLTFGIIEMGLVLFTWVVMEGSMREASRFGITGVDPDDASRLERIVEIVEEMTFGMVDVSTADVDVRKYPTFADVGKGESFKDTNPANGKYDPGELFTDCNGNGKWDNDRGNPDDPGGSGEVVMYTIRYDYPLIMPMISDLLGEDGKLPLSATVVVRNEPWDTTQTAEDLKSCDP